MALEIYDLTILNRRSHTAPLWGLCEGMVIKLVLNEQKRCSISEEVMRLERSDAPHTKVLTLSLCSLSDTPNWLVNRKKAKRKPFTAIDDKVSR